MNFLGKFASPSLAACVHFGEPQFMDQVSVTAASGLQSRMQALDLVANNYCELHYRRVRADGSFIACLPPRRMTRQAKRMGPPSR